MGNRLKREISGAEQLEKTIVWTKPCITFLITLITLSLTKLVLLQLHFASVKAVHLQLLPPFVLCSLLKRKILFQLLYSHFCYRTGLEVNMSV